jgi:hypothetical protein
VRSYRSGGLRQKAPSISVSRRRFQRGELQDIWAKLLAAAADPARAKSFRLRFIETAKQMDPLDAVVLSKASAERGGAMGELT